ncbi:MAG: hypothetical protein IJR44_06175, partial [Neisseriaceae bacterium]|nr:hypothetical protein [Neisseriaceae bacterium]
MGKTNFFAVNLANRSRFDSVVFQNVVDDGGRNPNFTLDRDLAATVLCVFDDNSAYFKHANNHGDFNPDDNRIFYSLFDIEQDSKQEM